jgi:hypothetical protein
MTHTMVPGAYANSLHFGSCSAMGEFARARHRLDVKQTVRRHSHEWRGPAL